MQLTHGMDCPPGGDLTATTALLQVPAVSVSVTANAADAVQQVDFVVSTTGASQADFRVTMPASNAVEANAQQPEAVALSTGEDAWLASPTSPAPVGASVRGVKRHTRRSVARHRITTRIVANTG